MLSSEAEEGEDLVGVIAGYESAARGDDLVNVLLSLDSRGCPGLNAESRHTVKFLLCCHVDRAIQRAEHAAAVSGGGVGVTLNLAHMSEGVVDVAAVFCAVLIFHIFVKLAVEGVDNNAVGEAVIEELRPIRERDETFISDKRELERIKTEAKFKNDQINLFAKANNNE